MSLSYFVVDLWTLSIWQEAGDLNLLNYLGRL